MLTTELDSDGIATVTIEMTDRPMNVVDFPLARALADETAALGARVDVRGIILTSAREAFIAGADLGVMAEASARRCGFAEAKAKVRVWTDSLRRIETCGKPVVAAATGTALGGGLEVMLACHHRIAAENPKARFGFPEVMLGLLPGAGGTQRTARLIGIAAALPLLLDGTRLTAAQAHEAGLLDAVVPPGDLLSAARAALLAGRVPAANPWDDRRFRPPGLQPGSVAALDHFVLLNGRVHAERGTCDPAPRAILSAVFEGARLPIARGLEVELDYFTDLVQGDVAQAMIATTFFARRAAAKGGWPAPDTEGPLVQRLTGARRVGAAALTATGLGPVFVENAARSVGLAPMPPAAGTGHTAPSARLMEAGRALLALIAAEALAFSETEGWPAARVDLEAVSTGFPVWTGGPLRMIDDAGAGSLAALLDSFGAAVPAALIGLAASGARLYPAQVA